MVPGNNCNRVHVKQIEELLLTCAFFFCIEMSCKCSLMLHFSKKLEEHSVLIFSFTTVK